MNVKNWFREHWKTSGLFAINNVHKIIQVRNPLESSKFSPRKWLTLLVMEPRACKKFRLFFYCGNVRPIFLPNLNFSFPPILKEIRK